MSCLPLLHQTADHTERIVQGAFRFLQDKFIGASDNDTDSLCIAGSARKLKIVQYPPLEAILKKERHLNQSRDLDNFASSSRYFLHHLARAEMFGKEVVQTGNRTAVQCLKKYHNVQVERLLINILCTN